MKKVIIVGSGGAGKSHLAIKMGERLELPVCNLDRLHWRPNWVRMPREEWKQIVAELCAGDRWIIDGNYGGTMDIRLGACDTVVFWTCPVGFVSSEF